MIVFIQREIRNGQQILYDMVRFIKGDFVVVPNTSKLEGLEAGLLGVYFWLCSFADNETGECFPAKSKLAKRLGCSTKTVERHIKELVEKGLITYDRQYKNNKATSNKYYIPILGVETPMGGSTDTADAPSTDTSVVENYTHKELDLTNYKAKLSRTLKGVVRIYSFLYRKQYGVDPNIDYSLFTRITTGLLKNYTPAQVWMLVVIHFEWRGIEEKDNFIFDKLVSNGFPFHWIPNSAQAYATLVQQAMPGIWGDEVALEAQVKKDLNK